MAEPALVQCVSTPLPPALAAKLDVERRQIVAAELRGLSLPTLYPSDAYAVIFLKRPADQVQAALQTVVADERRRVEWHRRNTRDRPLATPGAIYMFWITGQPANQIKIGRSQRAPRKRAAEWARSLSAVRETSVNLLFSFPTKYNELAEALIHTTLACERLDKLRHPTTGRELTEFFAADNVLALRLFVALCVQYADELGARLYGSYASPPNN